MGWKWLEKLLNDYECYKGSHKPSETVAEPVVTKGEMIEVNEVTVAETEPNIAIFNQRVEINGNYNPKDLALTMYLIHIGEYATLMVTALKLRLAQSHLTAEEQNMFLEDFTFAYQTLIANDKAIKTVFSTRPVVRPTEAFRQGQ